MYAHFSDILKAFRDHFPDVVRENPRYLQASEDGAVGQWKGHKNTVGTLPVYTCPGATDSCTKVCYAMSGRMIFDQARAVLARNTHVVLDFCKRGLENRLADEFIRLIEVSHQQYRRRVYNLSNDPLAPKKEIKHLKRGPIWRWSYSGDLVHPVHARAVRRAAEATPEVQQWIYTRSLHLVGYLAPVPGNLQVWLSRDADNSEEVEATRKEYPWVRIADMIPQDLVKTDDIICPKLRRRENGKLVQDTMGACHRCRICVDPGDKVGWITFPEHVKFNYKPPSEELIDILWG